MAQPILRDRDYNFQVSVFEKETDKGTLLSVVLQRSYKKKDSDEYTNETINLFPNDLLKISQLCSRVYNKLVDERSNGIKQEKQPKEKSQAEVKTDNLDDNIPF